MHYFCMLFSSVSFLIGSILPVADSQNKVGYTVHFTGHYHIILDVDIETSGID